ncbi:MAG: fimbrillin family protein [Rikenellaceae bacterium]|nr:fimbrillin family protein [Rikenellaceae bacterium]
MKNLTIICFSVFLFASCTKDPDIKVISKIAVQFATYGEQGEAASRASDNTWHNGDMMGIFMIDNGTVLAYENISNNAFNRKYITEDGDGEFVPYIITETVYFPSDTSLVDFVAYHPFTESENIQIIGNRYLYPININDQSNIPALDLVYSNNVTGMNLLDPVVPLKFEHMMSHLVFNFLPAGDVSIEELEDIKVTVHGMYTEGGMFMDNGSFTYESGSIRDIAPLHHNSSYAEAMVLPTPPTPESNRYFSLQIPNINYKKYRTAQIVANYIFESGTRYNINVRVDRDTISVEYELSDWIEIPEYIDSYPEESLTSPNCYIVKPGMYQEIPVLKAYTVWATQVPLDPKNVDLSGKVTSEVIWEEIPGLIKRIEVEGKDRQSLITVYTEGSKGEGNALVGVYIGGTLRWSWHIWVTNYDPETENLFRNNGMEDNTIMDRNLGALSKTPGDLQSFGMYYQHGRKDPFPRPASLSSSNTYDHMPLYDKNGQRLYVIYDDQPASPNMANSVKHPYTFYSVGQYSNYGTMEWYSGDIMQNYQYLWYTISGKKGIYDPCPRGWRVPYVTNYSPWAIGTQDIKQYLSITTNGLNLSYPDGSVVYFPANGMMDSGTGGTTGAFTQIDYFIRIWHANSTRDANTLYNLGGIFINMNTALAGTQTFSGRTRQSYGMNVRCVKEK